MSENLKLSRLGIRRRKSEVVLKSRFEYLLLDVKTNPECGYMYGRQVYREQKRLVKYAVRPQKRIALPSKRRRDGRDVRNYESRYTTIKE